MQDAREAYKVDINEAREAYKVIYVLKLRFNVLQKYEVLINV